jgi:hypothetical protein
MQKDVSGRSLRRMLGLLAMECVLTIAAMAGLRAWILPSFTDIQYSIGSSAMQRGTLPLHVRKNGSTMLVRATVHAGLLRPAWYRIAPDNCVR